MACKAQFIRKNYCFEGSPFWSYHLGCSKLRYWETRQTICWASRVQFSQILQGQFHFLATCVRSVIWFRSSCRFLAFRWRNEHGKEVRSDFTWSWPRPQGPCHDQWQLGTRWLGTSHELPFGCFLDAQAWTNRWVHWWHQTSRLPLMAYFNANQSLPSVYLAKFSQNDFGTSIWFEVECAYYFRGTWWFSI